MKEIAGTVSKHDAALRRDVRHPDEAPFFPFASVEGVLDAPPGVRVLLQHQFFGEVPPVGLFRHGSSPFDVTVGSLYGFL